MNTTLLDFTAITPHQFRQPVTIGPIFAEAAESFDFGESRSLPLGEAIVLLLDGEPGFNLSKARVAWSSHSLGVKEAKAIAALPQFPQI